MSALAVRLLGYSANRHHHRLTNRESKNLDSQIGGPQNLPNSETFRRRLTVVTVVPVSLECRRPCRPFQRVRKRLYLSSTFDLPRAPLEAFRELTAESCRAPQRRDCAGVTTGVRRIVRVPGRRQIRYNRKSRTSAELRLEGPNRVPTQPISQSPGGPVTPRTHTHHHTPCSPPAALQSPALSA